MFLNILECRMGNEKNNLRKTLKMWSQKSTRRTSFVLRTRQILWALSWFLFFFIFLSFFLKVVLWTNKRFFHKFDTTFLKQFFRNFLFLFSTVKSKMSRNLWKLRHKVRNGHESPNLKHFQSVFSNKILLLILGFQKHIASIHLKKIHLGYTFLKAWDKKQKFNLKNLNWTFQVSLGPHFAVAKWILI